MMQKPLLIVAGEPNSIFSELFLKIYKSKIKKIKIPIILIVSKNLFKKQMNKLKYSYELNIIETNEILKKKIDNNFINIIDVEYKFTKCFEKISYKSKSYIEKSFSTALKILKNNKGIGMINGPVSKKYFLRNRYPGITEYLSDKTKKNDGVMLIYNKKISVSPITTHIPIRKVAKKIDKKTIVKNILQINNFYKSYFKKKISIAVLGLNPHCETNDILSEEDRVIKPAIKLLKNKNILVKGPFSADTLFLKQNLSNFNVVVGMYHDQVLTPIKTLHDFNAINITLGLPFLRITPDHGPNQHMIGKNISNPKSLYLCIDFFEKLNGN